MIPHVWGSALFDEVVALGYEQSHVTFGQRSEEYSMALWGTGRVWDRLVGSLPPDTTLVGTADHGHCDIRPDGKITLDTDLTDRMQTGETDGC